MQCGKSFSQRGRKHVSFPGGFPFLHVFKLGACQTLYGHVVVDTEASDKKLGPTTLILKLLLPKIWFYYLILLSSDLYLGQIPSRVYDY